MRAVDRVTGLVAVRAIGGDKDHRHSEDQGRVREGKPASRGAHHGLAPPSQHHSPLRNSQGINVLRLLKTRIFFIYLFILFIYLFNIKSKRAQRPLTSQ